MSQVSGDEDFNAHYEFMKNTPNMEFMVKGNPCKIRGSIKVIGQPTLLNPTHNTVYFKSHVFKFETPFVLSAPYHNQAARENLIII